MQDEGDDGRETTRDALGRYVEMKRKIEEARHKWELQKDILEDVVKSSNFSSEAFTFAGVKL